MKLGHIIFVRIKVIKLVRAGIFVCLFVSKLTLIALPHFTEFPPCFIRATDISAPANFVSGNPCFSWKSIIFHFIDKFFYSIIGVGDNLLCSLSKSAKSWVCIFVSLDTHSQAHTYTHPNTPGTQTHTRTQTQRHTQTQTYIHIFTCTHRQTHIHNHTTIHTYVDTHENTPLEKIHRRKYQKEHSYGDSENS